MGNQILWREETAMDVKEFNPNRQQQAQFSQIIPAPGWYAVYLRQSEPWWGMSPLVGWALVREQLPSGEVRRRVVGLCAAGMVQPAEHVRNFHRYVHESEVSEADQRVWARAGFLKFANQQNPPKVLPFTLRRVPSSVEVG
jgi:hypothetical protein